MPEWVKWVLAIAVAATIAVGGYLVGLSRFQRDLVLGAVILGMVGYQLLKRGTK